MTFNDQNAAIALSWAYGAIMPMRLPESLSDVQTRINLLRRVDRFIVPKYEDLKMVEPVRQIGALSDIAKESLDFLGDVKDEDVRKNIVLRLWSGYIHAAEAISESIAPAVRRSRFEMIDYLCLIDPLFKAGVECAPVYKTQLGEKISLDGVPESSSVRAYYGA
jgi:hypothetical protein